MDKSEYEDENTEPVESGHGGFHDGLPLDLVIEDPEVISILLEFDAGEPRDAFALRCIRIGALAMRHAGTSVDAQKLQREGDRLIREVQSHLELHANTLNGQLQGELKRYFDPQSGHLQERVRSLVSEDGELSALLRRHIDGDSSVLALQLAKGVGENSPLMQYLSPTNKAGLVETLTEAVHERLEQERAKVLGEFDLNNKDSALRRLVDDIQANFDPDKPDSVTTRLEASLEATRQQIKRDLTLDDETSPLSNLHAKIKGQLSELFDTQVKFQREVTDVLAELRGQKKERDKSTRGGFDYEDAAGHAIEERTKAWGDVFERAGDTTGLVPRSKVGDHVQTLGADSASPGACIVYECKRDDKYTMRAALDELDEARRNRGAQVGVFVLAASSLAENKKMQREFDRSLIRNGQDIIVVWDEEDSTTDVTLEAAMSLARFIAIRDRVEDPAAARVDWEAIDRAINEMVRQLDYFDDMSKLCSNIDRDAGKVSERLAQMQKTIKRDLDRLGEQLDVIRS